MKELLQYSIQLAFEELEPLNDSDVKITLAGVVSAHNRFSDRFGYSPAQRVLGQSPVYPEDMLSDRHPDSDVLSVDGVLTFQRTMELRAAAMRAFVSHNVKRRLTKASAAKTRTQEQFRPGDVVFLLRQPRIGTPYRLGPGTVITVSGGSAWISAH
eukprot:4740983-Amphidinium_carterae.2